MVTLNNTPRTCKVCGEKYPLTKEHFRSYKDKNNKYYFRNTCINCDRKIDKQKYTGEDGAAKMRDWRHNNPQKAKEAKRRSEKRHPETVKARKKRSHIRCQEKNNKRSIDWHYANKQHANEMSRQHYQEHRDEIIAYVIQYQRDNPEQFRSVQHRRRTREVSAEGSFTAIDIQQMYEDQNEHCAYCGIDIFWTVYRDIQIEHITPLSRGGTNWPHNICLSCRDCNLSKHDKTLAEWETVRGW